MSFWEGLKGVLFTNDGKLVGVRAILALSFTGATIALWLQEITVPPELLTITSGTVAFYFGSRVAEVNNGS